MIWLVCLVLFKFIICCGIGIFEWVEKNILICGVSSEWLCCLRIMLRCLFFSLISVLIG